MKEENKKKDLRLANAASRVMKIKRQRSRYERPIHALWELFSDYSEISTIHGVRYLGEKKRHWTEKIWWFIAFTLSVVTCTAFIYQAWLKWQNSPVIVSFSEESTPVYNIPFPTVTICTDIKVKQRALNFTDIWHKLGDDNYMFSNLSKETIEKVHTISPLCDKRPLHLKDYMNRTFNMNISVGNDDIFDDIISVSPRLNETLFKCIWNRQESDCTDIFHEVLTDEGLCYSFNMLNASEIYREELLETNFHVMRHNKSSKYWKTGEYTEEEDIYPYRVLSGSEGLSIDMRLSEKDIDYVCSGPVQSFKILLHPAGEIPQLGKYYYRIPLDHDVVFAVRPNIMNTTASLIENYSKEQRKCVAEGERKLVFFTKYTQRNCQLDNIALRTARKCGCVTFSTPRLRQYNTPICRFSVEMECVKSVEINLMKAILHKKAISYNCLPSCDSITYDAEMSLSVLDRKSYRKAARLYQSIQTTRRRYARIFISFKDEQFFSSRRSEIYGKTDFIANCGGIMGLFMGVSILSIVEILYFSTLRIGCNLRKRRAMKKRRAQQLKALNQLAGDEPQNNKPSTSEPSDNVPEMKF